MQILPEIFETAPVVYAVKDRYVIIVPVKEETVMWVRVGSEEYYDESNGILRSATVTHKIEVPMEVLDKAGAYTVCFRRVFERHSYFSKVSDEETYTSVFRPVPKEPPINVYHLADAHNYVTGPALAASYYGDDLHLLCLNGDICENSGKEEGGLPMHRIAAQVTKGEIPVVFARGNHDTRGKYAERLANHTPTDNGNSFYTVRLGTLWMCVLDCGEDKPDDHEEYGHTMCCSAFRKRETAFLRDVIRHKDEEYEAEGVKYRIVMAHNPFNETHRPPFDIEIETFTDWTRLLNESVKPNLMLSGHTHRCYIIHENDEGNRKGAKFPVVVGAKPTRQHGTFLATAVTLRDDKIEVRFTDHDKAVQGGEDFPI